MPYNEVEKDYARLSAGDYLIQAAETLNQRGKDYDKPEGERSMQSIVKVFNIITKRDLTEAEGWTFMQCLKLVRTHTGKELHQDSMLDMIAYSALLTEAANGNK